MFRWRSSAAICWLTAGCVSPSSRAAADSEPSSATRMKVFIAAKRSTCHLKYFLMNNIIINRLRKHIQMDDAGSTNEMELLK